MSGIISYPKNEGLAQARAARAAVIATAGGIEAAIERGLLRRNLDISVSEALVLGLLRQNVTRFFAVFGHGSTEIGEVLRIYSQAGLVRVFPVRSEIEASHAATALRWIRDEKAAVITSIGPGALQAFAASLTPASNGIGVWYLLGDETTEDEGYNMQQVPRAIQGQFASMFGAMGRTYSLHSPGAIHTALNRGRVTVDHPQQAGPYFLLLPMNIQAALLPDFNFDELPAGPVPGIGACDDDVAYSDAASAISEARRVVIRAGGGCRDAGKELRELAELADAVVVTSPLVSGVIPYSYPRNMTVGGSKGSICGNRVMAEADLLIVVGSRSVCQSDSSRTAWESARKVIHINVDVDDALHYNRTIPLVGDAAGTLARLNAELRRRNALPCAESDWLAACTAYKQEWERFKGQRYETPTLYDDKRGQALLTQPAAIKIATDWARDTASTAIFDAGDVQANGFQIVEDDHIGQTFTDTGASYMGFACCAVLASAASPGFYPLAFTGDGSFMMNPQVLIDAVEHKARGCILLLDNRRMAAISGLQRAQYGADFATDDAVEVDYVALAAAVKGVNTLHGGYSPDELRQALDRARAYKGLSLIHLPVYFGENELGGLGAYGRWNVGNWCAEVQALRHRLGL